LTAALSRLTAAAAPHPAAPSADGKTAGDAAFDGAREASASEPISDAALTSRERAFWRLGAAIGARVRKYKAKRAQSRDDFGGPKPTPLSPWGRARAGARAGLSLVGVAALVPWPLFLSPERMQALGRVELLIHDGPKQIAGALVHAPLEFLAVTLPLSTFVEEFTYRFWDFGLDFAALALARPVAAGIAKLLEQVPDASGFRSKAQSVVRGLGGLIGCCAFPLAAAQSAFSFASAHIAHWGFDPALFAIDAAAAIAFTKLAYRTRGLTAPFVAHLTFNLAMLGTGVLALTFGQPGLGLLFAVAVSIAGVYSWLSERAARSGRSVFRGRALGAKLLAAFLLLAPLIGPMNPFQSADLRVPVPAATSAAAAKPDPNVPVVVPDAPAPSAAPAASAAPALSAADMVARVKPSVLKIIVMQTPTSGAIGSGVIVTPQGLAVTNGHVVGDHQPGDVVMVELSGGQQIPARIVAVNHDRDLAFLQLPKRVDWPTSPFAPTAPREGDEVFAMGHPLDLPFTVTRGIVSGRGERSNMYVQYVQTDASINHGNSGGPLYNAQGQIVGINTLIIGADGSIGLGFSLTAAGVQQALAQYQAAGNIDTASIGVVVDVADPVQPSRGVAVEYVAPGSAADKAGLMPGDVILGLRGLALTAGGGAPSARVISAALAQAKPGDTLTVQAERDGRRFSAALTLDAKRTTAESSGAHDFDGDSAP
jgi:serine protease Do